MSIAAKVENHINETKLHPDVAEGLRLIAARLERLEAQFARMVAPAPEELRQHILDGVPLPEDDDVKELRAGVEEVHEKVEQVATLLQIEEPAAGDLDGQARPDGEGRGVGQGGDGGSGGRPSATSADVAAGFSEPKAA